MAHLIKVTVKVKSDGYGYGFGFRSHYGGHSYTSEVKKGFERDFAANFDMKLESLVNDSGPNQIQGQANSNLRHPDLHRLNEWEAERK